MNINSSINAKHDDNKTDYNTNSNTNDNNNIKSRITITSPRRRIILKPPTSSILQTIPSSFVSSSSSSSSSTSSPNNNPNITPDHSHYVTLAWSVDGHYLAGALQHGPIILYAILPKTNTKPDTTTTTTATTTTTTTTIATATATTNVLTQPFTTTKRRVLRSTPLRTFKGHTSDVLQLTFSRSSLLASASMDRSVRLWHPHSAHCLRRFAHPNMVTCVAFHQVHPILLTAGCDAIVRLWTLVDADDGPNGGNEKIQDKENGKSSEISKFDIGSVITSATFIQHSCVIGTYDGKLLNYPLLLSSSASSAYGSSNSNLNQPAFRSHQSLHLPQSANYQSHNQNGKGDSTTSTVTTSTSVLNDTDVDLQYTSSVPAVSMASLTSKSQSSQDSHNVQHQQQTNNTDTNSNSNTNTNKSSKSKSKSKSSTTYAATISKNCTNNIYEAKRSRTRRKNQASAKVSSILPFTACLPPSASMNIATTEDELVVVQGGNEMISRMKVRPVGKSRKGVKSIGGLSMSHDGSFIVMDSIGGMMRLADLRGIDIDINTETENHHLYSSSSSRRKEKEKEIHINSVAVDVLSNGNDNVEQNLDISCACFAPKSAMERCGFQIEPTSSLDSNSNSNSTSTSNSSIIAVGSADGTLRIIELEQ